MHVSSVVRCPSCGRSVEWTESSPWRPFCSERCKLMDLGAWASEKHAIAGDAVEEEGKPRDSDEGDER
ncbi:MAG TPA: DNA gyrase inhibitor YacG [Steroidobacteraceae bacterium]|nr:DNA gyrase inhibitor YacG [Steroidobacteraceae bacterium]